MDGDIFVKIHNHSFLFCYFLYFLFFYFSLLNLEGYVAKELQCILGFQIQIQHVESFKEVRNGNKENPLVIQISSTVFEQMNCLVKKCN